MVLFRFKVAVKNRRGVDMCGQAYVQMQTPEGKSGETDGKTQRSCDTLVPEWTPNENPDRATR